MGEKEDPVVVGGGDDDDKDQSKMREEKENGDDTIESEEDNKEEEEETTSSSSNGKKEDRRKSERKNLREAKLQQQEELMAKIPKFDKDGIAYTKFQIRKMLKRVKKGLPPILTEQEERDRQKNEAQLRYEEELELAGLIYNKHKNPQEDDEMEEEEGKEEDEENQGQGQGQVEEEEEEEEAAAEDGNTNSERSSPKRAAVACKPVAKKKPKRSKPVPTDYVCSACQNKHQPPHWIYDCPDKVTKPGSNQKKKFLRGLNEPENKKVFVSGLPFDVKPNDIKSIFGSCGTIVSHRLLTFQDTGRCKGQAFVSFDTEEAATKAIEQISGTVIDSDMMSASKEKNEKKNKKRRRDADPEKQKKKLKLKVSKVLNRRVTKGAIPSPVK